VSPLEALPSRRQPRWAAHALFALLHFGATLTFRPGSEVVQQALVWLPSGIGIGWLWCLGPRGAGLLFVSVLAHRWSLDYAPTLALTGALGSTSEALLGAWLLSRLEVEPQFLRLRDVLGLAVAAALAPLASLACSFVSRSLPWFGIDTPVFSGWDGWWRMNALGILVCVPLVGTLRAAPRPSARECAVLGALAVALLSGIAAIWFGLGPDPLGILLLYLLLPLVLYAALRHGPRGTALLAAVAVVATAYATHLVIGPFQAIAIEQRHFGPQLYGLFMGSVPLAFGALVAERERALHDQARSDAARQAIQRFLPDMTYRLDARGRVLSVYAPSDPPPAGALAEGDSLLDVLPPEAARLFPSCFETVQRGGAGQALRYQSQRNFRTRYHEVRLVSLLGNEALALVHDVTARQRAQDAADWDRRALEQIAAGRASHHVLTVLVEGIESTSDGGLGSVLLLVGRRLKGGPAPNLPSSYVSAIDGFEIGPEMGSCGTAAALGSTVIVDDIASDPLWSDYRELAELHGLRACWSVPIKDSRGDVLGTFALYYREVRRPEPGELPLLERAAALASIALEHERSENMLATIHRNVAEGIFRSTPGRGLLYVNEACARMFGFDSPQLMLAVDTAQLYADPRDRERLAVLMEEHGAVRDAEVEMLRVDGTPFIALINATAVRDVGGRVVAYDGAVSDISARKRLEEDLRQAQKLEAVGRLAGGVAHDFNNLLTAIYGFTESLAARLQQDARARSDAEQILHAAERAAALTRQLLAYSRQQVLAPQEHDLSLLVDELGTMLRRLIGEHIQLLVRHEHRPILARVDRTQFEQVVLNLALNARDAMPQGGRLEIATSALSLDADQARSLGALTPGEYVRIDVADNGHGMDAATRARAFDPFFTTKEMGKGTGLGLSTVYGIVRQSDGEITLRSAPGRGACFSVFLPRIDAPARTDIVLAPALPRASRGGRILLAEDEPAVRAVLAQTLESAGFEVIPVADGAEALAHMQAQARAPDLIVTDMIMPHIGGRELARRLREDHPHLPVLVVSGYAPDAEWRRPEPDPDCEYLQKPFTRAQLVQRVETLLTQKR